MRIVSVGGSDLIASDNGQLLLHPATLAGARVDPPRPEVVQSSPGYPYFNVVAVTITGADVIVEAHQCVVTERYAPVDDPAARERAKRSRAEIMRLIDAVHRG